MTFLSEGVTGSGLHQGERIAEHQKVGLLGLPATALVLRGWKLVQGVNELLRATVSSAWAGVRFCALSMKLQLSEFGSQPQAAAPRCKMYLDLGTFCAPGSVLIQGDLPVWPMHACLSVARWCPPSRWKGGDEGPLCTSLHLSHHKPLGRASLELMGKLWWPEVQELCRVR